MLLKVDRASRPFLTNRIKESPPLSIFMYNSEHGQRGKILTTMRSVNPAIN